MGQRPELGRGSDVAAEKNNLIPPALDQSIITTNSTFVGSFQTKTKPPNRGPGWGPSQAQGEYGGQVLQSFVR